MAVPHDPWKGVNRAQQLFELVEAAHELQEREGRAPSHREIAEKVGYPRHLKRIDGLLDDACSPQSPWNREDLGEGALLEPDTTGAANRYQNRYRVTELGKEFLDQGPL